MAGKLRYTLVRRNPETHEAVSLVAGSELPDWAKDLVHADNLDDGSGGDGDGGPPAKSAAKKEWVAYAVDQGADEAEAEAMTKDDLVDKYGE